MTSWVAPVPLLLAVTLGTVFLPGQAASAQSLGGVAAQEAARRKAIRTPARVITADDLATATAATPAAPSPEPALSVPAAGRVLVTPAHFTSGNLPIIPIQAVSAGEVILEVAVDKTGRVTGTTPLRHTAPFTDAVATAVRGWTFAPAQDAPQPPAGAAPDAAALRPMEATVLVMAIYRPPALFGPTLGEPPKNVARPTGAAPFPLVPLKTPPYPNAALSDGVVLFELEVAGHGGVDTIRLLKSSPPFDDPAYEAASALIFAPARVHSRPVAARVYVVYAFRQPVTF